MDAITFHLANEQDIQHLVDYRLVFAIELAGPQPPETIGQLKEELTRYFRNAIASKSCIGCVAKHKNEIAGIGALAIREEPGNFKNPSGKVGYLMNMYTIPQFRRRGVCTGLLNTLTAEAKRMGISAFELHATEAGEHVYKQNDFVLHPEPTYRKYT